MDTTLYKCGTCSHLHTTANCWCPECGSTITFLNKVQDEDSDNVNEQ